MSGNSWATRIYDNLGMVEIRILRYAFGSTLAMAVAMGFDWPLSYLTPVLTLSFLASPAPRPSLKMGINFVLAIAIAGYVGLLVGRLLLPYPFVYIPFVGLLLFRIYYAKGGSLHPLLILWLLIALLIIPLMMMQSHALANIVAFNLVIGGGATLLVVWISYALLPDKVDKESNNAPVAKPPAPDRKERFRTAVDSTIVVFPVLILFTVFEMASALLILIMIALLSMQPGFAKDFKGGKALIIGNSIGGFAAIIFYELLVIIPEYVFLIVLTLLAGLMFGSRLFSGKSKAALYGMAFSTLLLVIGSTTSSSGEADAKVYTRIIQLMAAVLYVVVGFGLLEHFKKLRRERRLKKKVLLSTALALFAAGCSVGPDFTPPTVTETETYRQDFTEGESIANLPWWELFGDTVLQGLITEALENNRDLRTSMARIDEARANLGIVRADLYPRLDYSVGGSYDKTFGDEKDASGSGSAVIDASYQVDLWGRISRLNEAALQDLLSTEEAYRGVTIALVAEVASSYFLLRDIDNRLLISEYTADARRKSLDVIEAKFSAGIVSEVDVNQSEIQLADAEASVKNFVRIRAQTENAISMLLSKPPINIERGLKLQEQVFPPEIPTGLPSDLLVRRPDLLEAERNLHAQTALIGVAEALKYPQLTLSADLGSQFSNVTTGFLGLGAQLFGPLFNAGANQRRVDVEVARTEQLLNQYEQTFYIALREVEDAMVAVITYEEEYQIRSGQVLSAQSAADLSWVRYEGGMTSYLEVLDLQRSLFTAQLKSSEALQQQLTSIVRLYKALGGGWIPEQDSIGYYNESSVIIE
ncbi:efflux transporter outer membrane subunit [Bacteroidota bacterium]